MGYQLGLKYNMPDGGLPCIKQYKTTNLSPAEGRERMCKQACIIQARLRGR